MENTSVPLPYRVLLLLLPRHRRERYGADMVAVLAEQLRDARARGGVTAAGLVLMKDTTGLMRFALRERWTRVWNATRKSPGSGRGGRFSDELRWAWRGVRARGGRAVLITSLIGVTVAANTLVFAVSDALVFNAVPFRDADRIVEIQADTPSDRGRSPWLSPALLDAWRRQGDLFEGVHGYAQKNVFVFADGTAEQIRTADVTPGLIEMIGARPRWGRTLTDLDAREADELPVLVREDVARQRFGDPAAAVGRVLETSAYRLRIVGVMPTDFRFPDSGVRIWRALDPRGPLGAGSDGVSSSIARLAQATTLEAAAAETRRRSAAVGQLAGESGYAATVVPHVRSGSPEVFLVLLGAAWCLLLTACANVANLELAGAVMRARTYALQLALGASRGTLVRVALLESACLLAGSLILAVVLAWAGMAAVEANLPARLTGRSLNALDLDARALAYMVAAAILTWLLATVPALLVAWRPRLMDVLKVEGRSVATSRQSLRLRRFLTIAEIAIGVVLLVGGGLYVRSYLAQVGIEKGFDSANVATMSLALPAELLSQRRDLVAGILDRVGAVPGVVAITDDSAPPSFGMARTDVKLEVDGRPPLATGVKLAIQEVRAAYFDVLRIQLRRGRFFAADEPSTNAIISEDFAAKIWPGQDAIGRRFRPSPKAPWYDVVGVTANLRMEGADRPYADELRMLLAFTPRAPPPPRTLTPPPPASPGNPAASRAAASGGMFGFATLIVRLDSRERASAALEAARAVSSRFRVSLTFVDDAYSEAYASELVATQVVSAFGFLAAVIAAVGVYGVMAFLVASRTREIGIRMALGADRRAVTRLVVGSSMRMALIGAALGLAAAAALSRYVESQLFSVAAIDPLTYAVVTLGVLSVAAIATWLPARQAAVVDPAVTLRAD